MNYSGMFFSFVFIPIVIVSTLIATYISEKGEWK
jgi:hypothetical protein